MTKPTMALAELAEKGPDADLLREMIQYVAQRMMGSMSRAAAALPSASEAPSGRTAATATASRSGRPALASSRAYYSTTSSTPSR